MTAAGDAAPASPGSLIVTFAGLYLRPIGGWIAVADLITLLGAAGVAPNAVRQALVRLKSRDFLAGERRAGRAGYALTEAARADLETGDRRIWRFGEAEPTDGWVLAVFSVPEHARAERHRLRTVLSWLGFGTVGAGVWIAPAALAAPAREQVSAAGLGAYVTWFAGATLELADAAAWWDLEELRRLYSEFLDRWRDVDATTEPGAAFAGYLKLVDDWRQFPRIDPGLPAGLLPPDWPGRRAFRTFSGLRDRWSDIAADFVSRSLRTR
ncbi:transcriptional regulator, PaaX family [Nakamurella panacisegetis]|uniref:Transcriptional regulator, PaaX family n=1 Tax=Nakamurella panacisegetis TaxID=1090615 RepID=A0A1H0MSL5_9ACTN|nr:PaaX family transcriptional regulator C-terminal domain-containing protein [Nakamurella panacisegetis]SDO83130.1 transcriptional regulator, PaaX family [Nakamurella panacisegetis]